MERLHTIEVGLGERAYKIHIGRDLLAHTAALLPFKPAGRALFILTDENVRSAAQTISDNLKTAGARAVHMLAIKAGEQAKSWSQLEVVLSWLLENHVDRQSVLFVVGGGVIGDLGGFAASLVMRGIDFVQVPTTLLAQVDSSVGGKTGINMPQGKNLVGAFHQPVCVLGDLDVLKTLPRRELLAGYAEVAKYGLIDDQDFFAWLEANGSKVLALDIPALAHAVAVSCRKKAAIVAADEREQGVRALLNLGHTFGHALEAAAGYDGRLLHGEAVAIGMVLAFQLSAQLGLCAAADAERVTRHLTACGLPTAIHMIKPRLSATADELMGYMLHDKKAVQGKAVFILARGIGQSFICYDVALAAARQVVEHSMQGD